MKSKLITLDNLQRAVQWIDEAIQAIQTSIVGGLKETSEVTAASLNNLNNRIERAKNASNNLNFERLSTSGSNITLEYGEECRGYKSMSTSDDLSLKFKLSNSGENYLLVENTSSENVSLDIGDIYLNNVKVSDVLKASDTVVLPVGMCYEISVVAFPDVAVVTVSDSLRYSDWYGVEVDTTVLNPVLPRIGSTTLHKSVPIQAGMKRCLQNDDGTVNYYLDASDSTIKEDGNAAVLDGTDGQVMVEIPEHYCRIEAGGLFGTKQRVKFSIYPLAGFTHVPKSYFSAFEAALDRTNNKLSSVINTTAQYRGGANDSGWDNTYRSQLGMPATNIYLTNFRTYASNRGTHWTCQDINIYTDVCMLYLVEYANRNIQASFTSTLTAEGYHQGGLGEGVSNMPNWDTYNFYRPVVPCGVTVSLGNATGVVTYNVIDSDGTTVKYAATVPSYRGIENLFGHIWKHTDGILVNIDDTTTSDVYVCTDNTKFSSTLTEDYVKVGEEARSNGWTKNVIFPYLIATEVGADSSTGWCDNHYTSLPSSGSSIRCVLVGGDADYGSADGFAYARSHKAPSYASTNVGSRLCYRA